MRSSHAVVGKFASAFHVADTPALRTIALISLEHANGIIVDKNEESRSSVIRTRFPARNHDLHGLFEVDDQESPLTKEDRTSQSNGVDPIARERDSSTTSSSATIPVVGNSIEPPPPTTSPPPSQEAQKPPSGPTANPLPVRYSNTAPYLGPAHSYMNDWESAPSSDIYTPPPDLRPWGFEDDPSFDNTSNRKSSGDLMAKASDRTAFREIIGKSSDTSKATSIGKLDHQHGGKGAANCPICRKAKQSSEQSHPPLQNPNDIPEFISKSGRGVSNGLFQSKFSSPSRETFAPQSPSNAAVAINRHGQRIDLPLPRPSPEDQARFDSRWHTVKLCNDHHLRAECSTQDCKYSHDPIDEGVRMALKLLARKLPCKMGTGCRQPDCPNGHHCPYRLAPEGCKKTPCAFMARGMHRVDDLTMERFFQAR